MEEHLSECEGPCFLVHDDLVWVCTNTLRLLDVFICICLAYNTLHKEYQQYAVSKHSTCYAYFLSSLQICLLVCVSKQSIVIKPRQTSREQSEDVVKTYTNLQICWAVFDLCGPCAQGHVQIDRHTLALLDVCDTVPSGMASI